MAGKEPTFDVVVNVDTASAVASGKEFFRVYNSFLRSSFREAVMATLKAAQAWAPKGDNDYMIDWTVRPPAIRKVSGGTLRRALTAVFDTTLSEVLVGIIGVPSTSPAAKYARMRELGGTITATKAPKLIFSPDGAHIVAVTSVHQEPRPYIIPALVFGWPLVKEVPAIAFRKASAARDLGLLSGVPMSYVRSRVG